MNDKYDHRVYPDDRDNIRMKVAKLFADLNLRWRSNNIMNLKTIIEKMIIDYQCDDERKVIVYKVFKK